MPSANQSVQRSCSKKQAVRGFVTLCGYFSRIFFPFYMQFTASSINNRFSAKSCPKVLIESEEQRYIMVMPIRLEKAILHSYTTKHEEKR